MAPVEGGERTGEEVGGSDLVTGTGTAEDCCSEFRYKPADARGLDGIATVNLGLWTCLGYPKTENDAIGPEFSCPAR